MANGAVAHRAEAREKDKKEFLEERGHRVVEVCRPCEIPQLFDDFRRVGVETKKFETSRKRFWTSARTDSRLKLSFISIPYMQRSTNFCEDAPLNPVTRFAY